MSQRAWSAAWGVWLGSVLTSFGVLEGFALSRRTHPTLSRTLARWLGVHPPTPWGRFALGAFLAAWTALTYHLGRIR